MDKPRYTLSSDDVRLMKQAIRRVKGGNGSARPVPTRRRNRSAGSPGNVIYAQVVGAVASGDPTFTFDNAVAIVGSVPTGGTGTAQNQYKQEYRDNDFVIIGQKKDNDEWVTEMGSPGITANAFDANETLDYDTTTDGEVFNATGRPIWDGNRSSLLSHAILASESPESFLCKVSASATFPPATMADLDVMGDDLWRFPTGDQRDAVLDAIPLVDPFGFLADVSVADYLYVRVMRSSESGFGGDWAGVVIRAQPEAENASTGGGGGDPWVGWPGPDPTTGVAPGIVFYALVNEAGHVTSGDATFAFDGGSTLGIGTAPASGTCNNTFGRAFINNEQILVTGDDAGNFYGIKIMPSIAYALVNVATGVGLDDSTFNIDGFTAISGTVPSTGVADNTTLDLQLANNQRIPVILKDDGEWAPLVMYDKATFVTTGTITARSGSDPWTWGSGNATMLVKTNTATATATGGTSVTLYNSTTATVATGRVVQGKLIDGLWFIDVDDC